MSSWEQAKLTEIIEIIGGGTPKRSCDEFWNGDIPWLSVTDFNNDMRFVSKSQETITKLGLEKSSTKLLNVNDLIISARGTVGCLAQLSIPMAFNQSCYGLRGKDGIIDNGFLYYFLKNNINQLKQITHGAVFDTITRNTFESIDIKFPSLDKQKEISDVLGNFDQRIQLNTQINQTLEQIAQAIFKSWFIDFDPVRAKATAKAEGATDEQANQAAMSIISGKSPAEFTAYRQSNPIDYEKLNQLAQQFPSEFEVIDEVEVPKGWEYKTMKDCCTNIKNGGTPKRSNQDYWKNGKIAWLSSGEVCNNKILVSSKEFITELGLENSSAKLVAENSTLIALYASPTAGKCAFCAFETTTNQAICSLQPKGYFDYFNYYSLQQKEEYFANQAVGSAQQNISKAIVEQVKILIPNECLIKAFHILIMPFMKEQIGRLKENQSLAELRDLLLPKLLSGEVGNV